MFTLTIEYSNMYGYTIAKGFTQGEYEEITTIYTDLDGKEVLEVVAANPDYTVIFG